jgi:hypothetical protein
LSNQGAQAFRSLGVQMGENIALLFENRLDFIALRWAAQLHRHQPSPDERRDRLYRQGL